MMKSIRWRMLIGAPGTGKTHQLINKIREEKADTFCFVSFTRRAAAEAKQRLSVFYDVKQLRNISTIHSMCFRLLGLKRSNVFSANEMYKFGSTHGYEFRGRTSSLEEDSFDSLTEEDIEFRQMLIADSQMKKPSGTMWTDYCRYKADNRLFDFNDMLRACVVKRLAPFQRVCAVDEIQDLTPLQLEYADILAGRSTIAYFAGDDNQMIFEWAGVDRERFLFLAKECEVIELVENHRVTGDIRNLAQFVCLKIRGKRLGEMGYHKGVPVENVYNMVALPVEYKRSESHLILARNGYLLKTAKEYLEDLGVPWSMLHDHQKSQSVMLSTIHGAKGAEADNVYLLTDVSPATYEKCDEDSEHRVWYVAVTRAKESLHIITPETNYHYDIS